MVGITPQPYIEPTGALRLPGRPRATVEHALDDGRGGHGYRGLLHDVDSPRPREWLLTGDGLVFSDPFRAPSAGGVREALLAAGLWARVDERHELAWSVDELLKQLRGRRQPGADSSVHRPA